MPDRAALIAALEEAGFVAAGDDADELVAAAHDDPDVLRHLVSRRVSGEPLSWLTGSVNFCGVRLFVAPGVYVPRSQTESLARRAAGLLPECGVAVDLCTGAGAIAAVVSAAVPTARVVASELDPTAVRCAERNGVEVLPGFLDDPLPSELEHGVDVLTAVVPYVPTDALRFLPHDVQAFEPRLALDGGIDGTDLLVEVVERSERWMTRGAGCCSRSVATRPDRSGRSSAGGGMERWTSWSTRTATPGPSAPASRNEPTLGLRHPHCCLACCHQPRS